MNLTITKQCEYCHQDFSTSNSRKKYCNKTCRNYASEVRTGKREAIPLPSLPSNSKPLSVEEKEQLLELLKAANEEIKVLENQIKQGDEANEGESFYWRGRDELRIKLFRLQEKRYDYYQRLTKGDGLLQGEEILKTIQYQPTYPLRELNDQMIIMLGYPKLPFVATVVGDEGSGKSILSVGICRTLIRLLQCKALYVVDMENEGDVLKYFGAKSVDYEYLSIKKADSIQDIEGALAMDHFEFLFIDSTSSFHFNAANIKKLRYSYPKLSIFCISRVAERSIKSIATVCMDTYVQLHPHPGITEMGMVDISGKAVPPLKHEIYDDEREMEITTYDEPQYQTYNKSEYSGFGNFC